MAAYAISPANSVVLSQPLPSPVRFPVPHTGAHLGFRRLEDIIALQV